MYSDMIMFPPNNDSYMVRGHILIPVQYSFKYNHGVQGVSPKRIRV